MNTKPPPPIPRLTVITLGVSNMRTSIAFYQALGFVRKLHETGESVAFFDTGGPALALFPWELLAQDVTLPQDPRSRAFRGMTLAWNCSSIEEVDQVLDFAVSKGASLLNPRTRPSMAAIPDTLLIPTIIPGKSWSRPASRSATTAASTCRTD